MAIAFVLTASFGLLLTMHIYVRPSRAVPRGFRILGFPSPIGEGGRARSPKIRRARRRLLHQDHRIRSRALQDMNSRKNSRRPIPRLSRAPDR